MKRVVSALLLLLVASCTVSLGQDPGGAAKNLPQIVARFKKVGQTRQIPATVVFTPKATGLFRISGFILLTTESSGIGSWNAMLSWTDVRARSAGIGTVTSQGDPSFGSPLVFAAQAGTPVKIQTGFSGDVNGSVYDAFYVIERLTKIPNF